jgi:hypothetical protein
MEIVELVESMKNMIVLKEDLDVEMDIFMRMDVVLNNVMNSKIPSMMIVFANHTASYLIKNVPHAVPILNLILIDLDVYVLMDLF